MPVNKKYIKKIKCKMFHLFDKIEVDINYNKILNTIKLLL